MADIAVTTANRVEIVGIPVRIKSVVAGEDILAGAPCTYNSAGAAVNSDANGSSPLNTVMGIATRTVESGEGLTLLQEGVLSGYTLTSQAYGTRIFVSDTTSVLADAAGTASLPVGRVEPAYADALGTVSKVLAVNIPA